MTAAAMTGADRRAQALGVPGEQLMEHAGIGGRRGRPGPRDRHRSAGAAARSSILAGPGNNGGDGLVAARRLAAAGAQVVVALVAATARPGTRMRPRNWDRIVRDERITIVHTPVARDVAMLGHGIEKAAVVVDALLGTGVRGPLREPIRSAVELINGPRAASCPGPRGRHADGRRPDERRSVRSRGPGRPDDHVPSARRPGLLTRNGKALAGRVLVAPIGIPAEADRG